MATRSACLLRRGCASAANADRIDKRLTGKLDADGPLAASMVHDYLGDIALIMRGTLDGMSADEAMEEPERTLRDAYGDVRVTEWRCVTEGDPRPCRITAEFESSDFAQRSGRNLIMNGSALGPRRTESRLPEETRWSAEVLLGAVNFWTEATCGTALRPPQRRKAPFSGDLSVYRPLAGVPPTRQRAVCRDATTRQARSVIPCGDPAQHDGA